MSDRPNSRVVWGVNVGLPWDKLPSLRSSIIRDRLGASRLPSLRSALRGLDPPGALPIFMAFVGAIGWHTIAG